MPNQLEMTKDIDFFFDFVLRGYDVIVMPSDKGDDWMFVSIANDTKPIYQADIPIQKEKQDPLKYEEEYEYAANAAIDLYEAEKGILGQGAGAETRKKSMKKLAFYPIDMYEDWFMSFKGTPFEMEAGQLLEELVNTDYGRYQEDPMERSLRDRKDSLIQEALKLDIERLKKAPKSDIEITIKMAYESSRRTAHHFEDIDKFLKKFEGCDLEPQAIQLMQELIGVEKQLVSYGSEPCCVVEDDIYKRMDDLLLRKIEWENFDMFNMVEVSPMETSLMSLMELVDMDEQAPVEGGMNYADPFEYYKSSKHKKAPELSDRSEYKLKKNKEEEEEAFEEILENMPWPTKKD